MKERPILFQGAMVCAILNGSKTQTRRVLKGTAEGGPRCPYGVPGDRLWVREAHALMEGQSFADGKSDVGALYRASVDAETDANVRWRPSIHMPRWACRLVLEVVAVRVERLQAISEADAMTEGWTKQADRSPDPEVHVDAARDWYADLWESINGAGSWDANPWVWVVEFRRVT